MKIIQEYPLRIEEEQRLMLPPDSEVLAIVIKLCKSVQYSLEGMSWTPEWSLILCAKIYKDSEPTEEWIINMIKSREELGCPNGDYKTTVQWGDDLYHIYCAPKPEPYAWYDKKPKDDGEIVSP